MTSEPYSSPVSELIRGGRRSSGNGMNEAANLLSSNGLPADYHASDSAEDPGASQTKRYTEIERERQREDQRVARRLRDGFRIAMMTYSD